MVTFLSLLIMCGFFYGLRHNLRSISHFCDSDYEVMFDKCNCTVINKNDKSIVFKGKRNNNDCLRRSETLVLHLIRKWEPALEECSMVLCWKQWE